MVIGQKYLIMMLGNYQLHGDEDRGLDSFRVTIRKGIKGSADEVLLLCGSLLAHTMDILPVELGNSFKDALRILKDDVIIARDLLTVAEQRQFGND